jgi:hypothetical protein
MGITEMDSIRIEMDRRFAEVEKLVSVRREPSPLKKSADVSHIDQVSLEL